ncbi:DUF1697 domain-containing protein, partial [Isoptericola sp. NPDC060257]|uniref:DUF1697 domain-containing protein n=1 Tax=Isoptericola sp. NPDC060257 TaxID=3347087 RepID=UPI003669759C
ARLGFAVPTLVRSRDELAAAVEAAPPDHSSDALRSEVFFLKHPLTAPEVLAQMPELREGVDAVAPGPGVVYFSRVAAEARRTRITRLMGMPVFRQMTVRTWRTTTRLSRCSTRRCPRSGSQSRQNSLPSTSCIVMQDSSSPSAYCV